MNRFGAGRSALIGTFLGFSALAYRDSDAGTDGFLAALLSRCGCRRRPLRSASAAAENLE